ncbi:MAG: asparagine synthase (glutamine-hydrolyzing), partial [Rhodospirillales bacterium]|nr:asparagine synthase (glutamine-hydrolyzing) [Rhodospirillales bacterium]
MCGIAGILSTSGIAPGVLAAMGDGLVHRGPDGSGTLYHSATEGSRVGFDDGPPKMMANTVAGFVHRRLKVLDLSDAAAQPMMADGVALIFNGEIYNYRDLRRELEAEGAVFSSSGDTEVVLKAYRAWGPNCFARFQGMWALVILDGPNNRVVLSRDRFGIKPLYYARTEEAFVFASEIKALFGVPGVSRDADRRTMARYLGLGTVDDGENTFFQDIRRFPAGHWGTVALDAPDKGVHLHRFWTLGDARFEGSFEEAAGQFREMFADAVRGHYHSDVASGSCLSGGLDSSSIVCTAGTLRGAEDLANNSWKAFGYVPADGHLSEQAYMEAAAKVSGAALDIVTVDDVAFANAVPGILSHHDEPVGSASVCAQWFVFQRAAAEGIRVMVDGQGADESFAGYQGYLANMARSPFRVLADTVLPAQLRRRLMRRNGNGVQAMTPALARLAEYDGPSDLVPRHDLRRTLAADLQSRILPALLRYEDTNAMAHSIEARVPFLDHRIVEFAFSLPDEWKISGNVQKHIVRQAMRGCVPDEILDRKDKIGFHAGKGRVCTFARSLGNEIIANATEHERDWFDKKSVAGIFDENDVGDERERVLWRVINAKLWARSLN